ncbi:MAG: branched-chain amino acid ABC transporter permease [Vulcanimicrobiaceae bacterium]
MSRGRRTGSIAIVAVVIAALPWLIPSYGAFEMTYAGAYTIAILGLIILTGMNGQISLGHGAFLAVGGYAVAILATRTGMPYWISVPIAGVLCGLLGVGIGLVSLRLAGVYLALATFSMAVATPPILKHFKGLTGGTGGIVLQPSLTPAFLHGVLTPERWLYYVTWALAGGLFAATALLLSGRIGRSLRALRDNETAAVAFGINPYYFKTLAFGWSAAYAGVAGAIVAIATAFVSPDAYTFALSITLLIGAVFGGLETMWGAIVGGIVIEFLPLWAQKINAAAPSVVYGVALIVIMILMPTGIAGGLRAAFRPVIPTPSRD